MNERKLKQYRSKEIVVRFDPRRCIHAAECVHGLPAVFDANRRPWIEPQRAGAERIAEVVERCPTGALTYERLDGGEAEEPAPENSARPAPNGPLYLRGRLRITLSAGEIAEPTRTALCRCGATGNAPFCDGSHVEAGFEDPGALGAASLAAGEADAAAAVEIQVAANGPLLVKGPINIRSVDGDEVQTGVKGALCRCGASANKPYCDGSHAAAGFRGQVG